MFNLIIAATFEYTHEITKIAMNIFHFSVNRFGPDTLATSVQSMLISVKFVCCLRRQSLWKFVTKISWNNLENNHTYWSRPCTYDEPFFAKDQTIFSNFGSDHFRFWCHLELDYLFMLTNTWQLHVFSTFINHFRFSGHLKRVLHPITKFFKLLKILKIPSIENNKYRRSFERGWIQKLSFSVSKNAKLRSWAKYSLGRKLVKTVIVI